MPYMVNCQFPIFASECTVRASEFTGQNFVLLRQAFDEGGLPYISYLLIISLLPQLSGCPYSQWQEYIPLPQGKMSRLLPPLPYGLSVLWVSFMAVRPLYRSRPITAGRDTLTDTSQRPKFKDGWLAAFWCKAAYSMPAVFKSVP